MFNWLKNIGLAGLCVLALNSGAIAQSASSSDIPDPSSCLTAISTLDDLFSDALYPQCLKLAGDACAKHSDIPGCLNGLNETMQSLYSTVTSGLPDAITGEDAAIAKYADLRDQAAGVFERGTACGSAQGISKSVCIYQAYGEQIVPLIKYAKDLGTWP